jgi:hypothetical protein
MITNTHKHSIEFSVSLSFCILIVLLVVSGSTAATLVYSSPGSGSSGSSSNITGNSAGGGSGNTGGGSGGSSDNGSPSKSGSGESTAPSGVTSESPGSGSSGSSNSTGITGGKSGRSQDSSTGSGSNSRGGTFPEGNDTNSGKSVIQRSTQCDKPAHPSCSSLSTEAGKNAPGTICPPRHSKAFCASYDYAVTNDKNNNQNKGSSSNNNLSSSPGQTEATHCDQPGSPSCYSVGFQVGKNSAGTICPGGHSANYCSGWKVGTISSLPTSTCAIILIKNHCIPTTVTRVTGLGTIREIAPGAPAGSHTLEYIQAFNTAAGDPYKPGTKQYQNYQAGLEDAKKAGRDCDKMDTCGGPDLLGNYVNGVLHLSDKQYCGNGFGVYSTKLCKFREGCIASIMGTAICPSPGLPLPRNCSYILVKLICRPS